MGNIPSNNSTETSETKFKNFYDVVDYIATYYILTMDFKSLSKLSEKAYCDKLVVLTADIIKRYYNDVEIEYLAQRIKDTAAGKYVYSEVNPDGSAKVYKKSDLPKLIAQLEQESGYNLDIGGSPTLKDTAKVKGRDKYVQDANQQLEMERAGGAAKQLKSALDPGHVAINPFDKAAMAEHVKKLVSQNISQTLAQRGETPFNLAMLQRASLNKNSQG